MKDSTKDKKKYPPKDKGGKKGSRKKKGFPGKKDDPKDEGKDAGKDKGADGYAVTEGTNALAWHTPDVALLERASAIPWSTQTGEIIDAKGTLDNYPDVLPNVPMNQPGILIIRDLINVGGYGLLEPNVERPNYQVPTYNAANTLLTEMRSKARIRNTYDAPDVFMLMGAMHHIYIGVTLAKRLAATVRMFTYKNQYLPEALLRAQGFDPTWFKKNQFTFVTQLNLFISEVNKVYIPDRMHLFQLINERFGNYFTEGEDIKDQLYVITPAFLCSIEYNPSADYASALVPCMCIPGTQEGGPSGPINYNAAGLYTGDQLLDTLRYMLHKVLTHDSTADITGDMENAFGSAARFILTPANPDSVALPVRDEEILETIHNMTWCEAVTDAFTNYDSTTSFNFKTIQNASDNKIGLIDYYESSYGVNKRNRWLTETVVQRMLDVHKDPNNQKTFAITRLHNMAFRISQDKSTSPTKLYINVLTGADLVCQVQFLHFKPGYGDFNTENIQQVFCPTVADLSVREANMQCFHYRPLRIMTDDTGLRLPYAWYCGETDIWTHLLRPGDYEQMNRISLLTLLGAYDNV